MVGHPDGHGRSGLYRSRPIGAFRSFGLHAVDAVGLVHAMLLRIQALLLPVQMLVLSGH
jgi:hypothetical protein